MSLVGAVSLTNKESAIFLGSVNLDNLNLDPDQLVYSTDGINLSGLNLGDGLQQVLNELQTVGNPDIQLTSNSVYVNENVGTTPIQTAVTLATQADVIYVSSGSYGEAQIVSTDKLNIAIMGPAVGTVANTICEVLNGFSLTGTTDLVRIANIQIKGASSEFSGLGRTKLSNCVFTGTALQTNSITFGANSSKFITVINCEFDQYCTINIPVSFTSVIYFINCGFNGCTFNINTAVFSQVIFNNCSGFSPSLPNELLIGVNVKTNGESQVNCTNLETTTVNGEIPLIATSQANNRIVTGTATAGTLHCNQDLHWDGQELELFANSANPLRIGRGNNDASSHTNTGIGVNALNAITSALNNTILGHQSGSAITTGSGNTFIGSSSCPTNTTLSNSVAVGYNSRISFNNAVTSGDSVCVGANSIALSNSAVVVGCNSYIGNNGAAIGSNVGRNGSTGTYNILLGGFAGNALTSGGGVMCIGSNSGLNLTSGNNNCFLGISSGAGHTIQSNNTCLGYYSVCNNSVGSTYYADCTAIGANCRQYMTGNDQIQLGTTSTNVYAFAFNSGRSDARDKADVKDTSLGLDFINKLRPVDFRWDYRDLYRDDYIDENHNLVSVQVPKDGTRKRNRFHHGLIAQDVKTIIEETGADFGGFQDHKIKGGDDVYTLAYGEFIAPLIKAVQELNKKNEQLEERIKILESK
jgi:hypothetical protein